MAIAPVVTVPIEVSRQFFYAAGKLAKTVHTITVANRSLCGLDVRASPDLVAADAAHRPRP
jgi:hypothetical protein